MILMLIMMKISRVISIIDNDDDDDKRHHDYGLSFEYPLALPMLSNVSIEIRIGKTCC